MVSKKAQMLLFEPFYILKRRGKCKMEKEYQMLRAEIESNIKLMHNYVTVTCTVMVGILTFIAQTESVDTYIFALIFAALSVVTNRVRSLLEANMRLSTYMEIILEPKISGRNWETLSHWSLNDNSEESKNSNIPQNKHGKIYDGKRKRFNIIFWNQQTIYVVMGFIVYFFYIITLKKWFDNAEIIELDIWNLIFNLIPELILFLFNCVVLISLWDFSRMDANNTSREDYKEEWIKIEEDQKKYISKKTANKNKWT